MGTPFAGGAGIDILAWYIPLGGAAQNAMIRIYFPPITPGRQPIALAAALRVGGLTGAKAGPGPERTKFDKLNEGAAGEFEVVDLDSADVVVYPYQTEAGPEVEKVAEEARQRNVGCIFFRWGDADEPLRVSYGTVYRHSMFVDTQLENERAMSADASDPQIELGHAVLPRERRELPVVGFCGYVSNPLTRTVYQLIGRGQKAAGLVLRARLLRALRQTKTVKTNFITRQAFWGGAHAKIRPALGPDFKPRIEFWNNVLSSDYTLCVRGAGNFSYRFYEVLAAGRIPIFINTRCVLPFDDEIDWRRHCVWIEESEIGAAGEIVTQFHSRLSPDEFRELQLANRRLWETKLSPLAFYKTALSKAVRQRQPTGTV